MTLHFRILGCGSSGGVPRIDGNWGACDPHEPKNRRSRCSLLVTRENEGDTNNDNTTNLLIDTSPDMREQLLAAQVRHIDAVLLTHDHADQTHGIDDLRALVFRRKKRIPIWMDEATAQTVRTRFAYCFATLKNSDYPSILEDKRLGDDGQPIAIEGLGGTIQAVPFHLTHGRIASLGYRIGDVIYSPDVSAIPPESEIYFHRAKIWIVDALRHEPHPTHFHLEQTLAHIEKYSVPRAILTNMHIDMDYQSLRAMLPAHIEPAYDGMNVSV